MKRSRAIATAVELLQRGGIELAPGLSAAEIRAAETRWGFRFAPDHAELLRAVLPVSPHWPNWREGHEAAIQWTYDALYDRIVFDVFHNSFWPASWGSRPPDSAEAEDVARGYLMTWPKLVPIFLHRFMAAAPAPRGAPVFSIHQTDAIYYGAHLVDYLRRELRLDPEPWGEMRIRHRVPYWSALVETEGDWRAL